MKLISQYRGLKKEFYILFIGRLVTAMGSFVWPMMTFTIGEGVSVLGENPYSSRRVPSSHRGRVGGISMVAYSLFSTLTQLIISWILYLTDSNYLLIWIVFILVGVVAMLLYLLAYRPDKKRFPKLYKPTER